MPGLSSTAVVQERERRFSFFAQLEPEDWVARGVEPSVLRNRVDGFCAFGGGAGIWVDASRTRSIADPGVTVAVLHTGRHYPDDVFDDHIVYHYPATKRRGQDSTEIAATKNAANLAIPLYVIIQQGTLRDVYMSWVETWNDHMKQFLITFATSAGPPSLEEDTNSEWVRFIDRPRRRTEISRRERDPRFSFRVFGRYGAVCAVCGLTVARLLDAAHIIPVADGGSNDARNGLPLCPTHHRAFDHDAFTINPWTLEIVTLGVDSLDDLRIPLPSIGHLSAQPHREALEWRWARVQ